MLKSFYSLIFVRMDADIACTKCKKIIKRWNYYVGWENDTSGTSSFWRGWRIDCPHCKEKFWKWMQIIDGKDSSNIRNGTYNSPDGIDPMVGSDQEEVWNYTDYYSD